ncbi:hypothetical protein KJN74_05335, partial [Candidatus Bathyarchaeota archaeon]|nr:hypothetical protein [Candidatus Bathyarchaeota archaeon]
MGALVAAVNKNGENVVPEVFSMLQELRHRGDNSHGIAIADSVSITPTLEESNFKNLISNIALGHNLSFILPHDSSQPIQGPDFTVVFEGRMFPIPNRPDCSESKEFLFQLGSNPMKNAKQILTKLQGSYVFAIAESKNVIVGRDVFGIQPIYYGENDKICAVASERKALWKLGLEYVKSFPPGYLATMSVQGFSFQKVKQLRMPRKNKLSLETAANALELLLLESMRKQNSDLESVAVAFSGGVDSSIIAILAKTIGLDVQLISVGLKDQPEVKFTEKAAKALGLPLYLQTYTPTCVKETLAKVLWLIEEPNVVNA